MEHKNFIYTPIWVRILSIGALAVTLVMSLFVTWSYLDTDKDTWVLVAMSLAQVSASGLAFVLVIFYSSRDAGVAGLRQKTNTFLCRVIPRVLLFIDFPKPAAADWKKAKTSGGRIRKDLANSPTTIAIKKISGDNSALYTVNALSERLTLRVQVNVWELTVSYYFPAQSEADLERLKGQLDWAMSRFTQIAGYKESWYFSEEEFDQQTYVSVHLTKNFDRDFLDDDRQKLNFAQDLAASSRSLIKECKARGIALSH
ncbi:hypothetical protein [Hoeflea olei]|nr:hypothetical protein [Hoeflea olei]